MATIRKSKKKVIVPICIVLVIAIVAGSIFGVVKSKSGEAVSLYTIATDDIHESVSLTGEVTSGAKKEYKVGTVAKVKEVYVKVGDKVKKGDLLATFDTESINNQVSSLQSAYNDAQKNYDNAVKSQKEAEKKAKSLKTQISQLEKTISKLEKKLKDTVTTVATTKKATTANTSTTANNSTTKNDKFPSITKTTTTTTTTTTTKTTTTTQDDGTPKYTVALSVYPSNVYGSVTGAGRYPQTQTTVTVKAIPNAGYEFLGWYASRASYLAGDPPLSSASKWNAPLTSNVSYVAVFVESSDPANTTTSTASINDIVTTLKTLNDNIASITNDVKTMTALTELVATTITNAISSGQLSSEKIAELVGKEMSKAIQQGIIDATEFIVESDVAVRMVQAAVASIDFKALAKGFADSDNTKLTSAQLQLALLTAQYELYKAQSDETIVDSQKQAVASTKTALDAMKEQQAEMQGGFKAAFDGVITSLDLTPGLETTAISTGIVLENLDTMVATVSLGEYDVHKVKVGMEATITTAYGTYSGEVATIAPTATGGSSSSILDSVGSMAGISGLSSLTDSGAGVECTITINEPDENIIVGFDADVEIETGSYLGVTVVPIESIELEKTGSYVYLYNDEDSTVTKTLIKTGASSDSSYQVLEGLKPGDKIVATPSSEFDEDTFKVKVSDNAKKK